MNASIYACGSFSLLILTEKKKIRRRVESCCCMSPIMVQFYLKLE
jgi:hypothetical protein